VIASDVIALAVNGELKNLSIDENSPAVLGYINLGLIELYKRFTIKTGVEVVKLTPRMSVYTLANTDVSHIVSIYDMNNKMLREPLYSTDEEYSYTILSYNTILFNKPIDENVMVVYKASPAWISNVEDELELPSDMIEPLLHYIGYRAHGALNGDIKAENNTHYMRFDKSCRELQNLGYNFGPKAVGLSTQDKGFI